MRFAAPQVFVRKRPQGRGLLVLLDVVGGIVTRTDVGEHVAGAATGLRKVHLAMARDAVDDCPGGDQQPHCARP